MGRKRKSKRPPGPMRSRYASLKGQAPGTLIHVGEKHQELVRIDSFCYSADDVSALSNLTEAQICKPDKPGTVHWFNVDSLHDTQLISRLGKSFTIHPLVLEDIVNTEQRPKADKIDEHIFITLKMLHTWNGELENEQVSFVLGSGYLLSFQERPGDVFDPVRTRLLNPEFRIRRMGADYLLFALMDVIVDNYYVIAEALSDELDGMEEAILNNPSQEQLLMIQANRTRIQQLRKMVYPLRDEVMLLEKEEQLVQEETRKYFRDLHDHVLHIMEMLDNMREVNSGLRDLYTSSLSMKMNKVIHLLTIISSIFIPLTFIAGVYGMNFRYMPELEMEYGYYIFWGFIIVIGLGLIVYFRIKKWL
jgi:magnesium transporter